MMNWGIMSLPWTQSANKFILFGLNIAVLSLFSLPSAHATYPSHLLQEAATPDELEVERIRDQEITQLKIILGRRDSVNRKPDILLRLAEIYTEKYRYYFLKETEVYQNLNKRGQKQKSIDHTLAKKYLTAATNSCLAILRSHHSYPKIDQVYFLLAYNYEELGKKSEAKKYYTLVAERYPRSPYVSEAQKSLGEMAYNKKSYKEALRWLQQAVKYTGAPSYVRTLYKLAWVHFRLRDYPSALQTMKKVADLSKEGDKLVALKEEALNDLVLFYSEAGRVAEARKYFAEVSGEPENFVAVLKRLTHTYEREGRYQQALKLNAEILEEYEDKRPDLVFDILLQNIELQRKSGKLEGEEKALLRLVDFFDRNGSDFVNGSEERKVALERTKSYLKGRATEVHKQAQKRNSKALYAQAADLYGLYIRAFLSKSDDEKDVKELSLMRVYRSDALVRAGKEEDALNEFERTLNDEGNPKNRREAGFSLLSHLIEKIDALVKSGKRNDNLEERFKRVSKTFRDVFPNDPMTAELAYKEARLAALSDKGGPLGKDAKNALLEFVEKYPSRKESVDVAYDLVRAELKAGQEDNARELAGDLLKNEQLLRADKKGDLKNYLLSVYERTKFTEVKNLEKDHEYKKAAEEYKALADSTQSPEIKMKALNNAAVSYEKAGLFEESLKIYEVLANRKDHSIDVDGALKSLATKVLWTEKFDSAAAIYFHFSKMKLFSEEERKAFGNLSFRLYWGLSDLDHAALVGKTIYKGMCAKSDDTVCEALTFNLANVYVERKDFNSAVNIYKSYLLGKRRRSGGRVAEAKFKTAEMFREFGDLKRYQVYLEDASRQKGSLSARDLGFTAHAAFLLVERDYQKFMAINIEGSDAEKKDRIKKKLKMMESLSARYNNVVGYGNGEWGIAALARLGTVLVSFARQMEAQAPPLGLNEESLQRYQAGLQSITRPFYSRALENLNKAFRKGLSLDVTTPAFYEVSQALSRANFREFPPAHYGFPEELKMMGTFKGDLSEWREELAAQALQSKKIKPELWVNLGNLVYKEEKPLLAQIFYEEALSLAQNNAAALNNLGVLKFRSKDYFEATKMFARSVALSNFSVEPRYNIAFSYLSFHLYPKALESFNVLRAKLSSDEEVTLGTAISELGMGKGKAAFEKLEGISARGKSRFALWYNWAVAAVVAGDESDRENGLSDLSSASPKSVSEQEMIVLSLQLFRGQKK